MDWYEACADLDGKRTRVQVFAIRPMGRGAAFHHVCLHTTQETLLEAHERAFDCFGGVLRLLRSDNLALRRSGIGTAWNGLAGKGRRPGRCCWGLRCAVTARESGHTRMIRTTACPWSGTAVPKPSAECRRRSVTFTR